MRIRPDGEPQWAWQLISVSVALFVIASAATVVTGLIVLLLIALD